MSEKLSIEEFRALPSSTRRHGENTATQVELPGIKHVSSGNRENVRKNIYKWQSFPDNQSESFRR